MTRKPGTVKSGRSSLFAWFGMAMLSMAAAVPAQTLRDPTVAPAAAGLSEGSASRPEELLTPGSVSVLVRDGVHYLIHGTRLYATGQRIGQVRIERISETEVWLREGGKLQKIQIFNGVQRRAAVAPVAPKKPSVAPVLVRPAKMTP